MRLKRYLLQGFLLLLCSMESAAAATFVTEAGLQSQQKAQHPENPQKQTGQKQTDKKPRMQTSAGPEDMVFKPQPEKPTAKASSGTVRYIALKTNIAYDAIAILNLALEVQCSKHISVELPLMCSFWDVSQKHAVRTVALQPEGRWWLKEAGTGHFFGLHAHIGWFNVKWNDDRYQNAGRPLLGAGVSYGYTLPLSAHWGAEFTLGAGYANMKYNTYYNIENGAQIGTESRNYWGITRLGLSLSYRF